MDNLAFASELVINGTYVKEVPCLVGQGEPSSDLGAIGCLYLDSNTNKLYYKNAVGWLGINIQKGYGTGSVQQVADDGFADGFNFAGKNPNIVDLDPSLNGFIDYGARGAYAVSLGGKSAAMGKRSHSEGTTTIAKGAYSHAEGDNSVALGDDSHAEGYRTISYGTGSHSEGIDTIAGGPYSHSEGIRNKSQNNAAHSEGEDNTVSGHAAHAEGKGNIVTGDYAHAEGSYNAVYAVAAHAEGQNNIIYENAEGAHVSGRYNHARHGWVQLLGVGLVSGRQNQTVVGQYNAYDDQAIFIVGNGTDENNPSNAFVVNANGTIIWPT